VLRALAQDERNDVVGIGDAANVKGRPPVHPRVRLAGYGVQAPPDAGQCHPYLRDHEAHIRRGQAVVRLALHLRDRLGLTPDVVVGHPGWGEGLFLRDVFPQARHVQYCEYYYQAEGGDVGFDPEFPTSLDQQLRVRIRNNTQLQSLVAADAGIAPTAWQKSRYPAELQAKIGLGHDGIDTTVAAPDAAATLELAGQHFAAGEEIVTYVARNLEPYRGFHTFMRMLPALQALRPKARVIVVGGDDVSYGRPPQGFAHYREQYTKELEGRVDLGRVCFTGKLPYAQYLKVLQVSAAHVYLTYPFVLSWSMLEAMAAGCVLVASRTAPVQEVIEEGRNGLLVDFFDADALARRIADVLAAPDGMAALRADARRTVLDRYDLHTHCLPRMLELIRG
jgi:glycosyltransferase involved in cell wall biosynthesis